MGFAFHTARPMAWQKRLAVLAFCLFSLSALSGWTRPAQAAESPPAWGKLNAEQQHVLAPLKADWPEFNSDRKKKWLDIAARYPVMSPQQQQTLQKRMNEWAHLSPEKRRLARENFLSTAKAPLQSRREAWEQYKKLPESERNRLKEEARHPKPHPGQVGRYVRGQHKLKSHPAAHATAATTPAAAAKPGGLPPAAKPIPPAAPGKAGSAALKASSAPVPAASRPSG